MPREACHHHPTVAPPGGCTLHRSTSRKGEKGAFTTVFVGTLSLMRRRTLGDIHTVNVVVDLRAFLHPSRRPLPTFGLPMA
ncbi:hypothetical protein cyc_02637 [Cyclospora cayetanensis]|uniref:Uncharacterized protein n=1 Tax=Cyclospora cayetanensis TaxID=88456 RepID=A0A1D3CRL3_9EIME|nr:hypothetical protein cyc_02637 [Cyclospora cayetanensis]